MGEEDMKAIAQEYAQEQVGGFEFLTLAEELEGVDEEDLKKIHDLIVTSEVTLTW